ncbi:MAG: hypothetical protein KF773_00635 [Deltaproteobacteria bacterium]|nr:hypothetical protein [Deltaproteobacteria bacterium]MCW5801295.1 hypothetical protein [Deltaproteobacteria bacterium]
MLRVLVVVLACSACTASTAPRARTAGKVLSLGGVVGLVGSALLTRFTEHGNDMVHGFALVTGVGIATYATGELTGPPEHEETIPERNRRWAQMITEHAAGAAREGRCARVRRLEPRVRLYNPDVHDFVFMRDPEIQKCLAAAAQPGERTSPEPDPSTQDP